MSLAKQKKRTRCDVGWVVVQSQSAPQLTTHVNSCGSKAKRSKKLESD